MTAIAFLVIVVLGIATILFSRKHSQSARRREILETPFPVDWQTILERNVGLYRQLPAAIRKDLHRRTLSKSAARNQHVSSLRRG